MGGDDKCLDEILGISSTDELTDFLDRDSLLFSRRVASKCFHQDLAVSSRELIKILYDSLDLSFAGVYINSGQDIAAEINRSTGDPVYGRISDISPQLLGLASCELIEKKNDYCFVMPLEYRGNHFGTAVFDKKEFSVPDLAVLKDVCFDFSRHVNNVRDIPKLRRLAEVDHLTRLYNRRRFDREYDRFRKNLENHGRQFSMIFGDIDRFKQINDTYGHRYGDFVLRKVSGLIQENIRDVDIAYRYGGEEFVVILPGADTEEADQIARRINDSIRSYRFVDSLLPETASKCYYGRRDSSKIRMSMGVASSDEGGTDLLGVADDRLLTVKDCCRDAVLSNSSTDSLTGIAGLSGFMQYLDNRLRQCNRTRDGVNPSSIAVLVFDVVRFSEMIRSYGSSPAWGMFREAARWLYDHHSHFDYVARVCDRDSLVVALSGDSSLPDFEAGAYQTARDYLDLLRSLQVSPNGSGPVTFDFAVGAAVYNPVFAKSAENMLSRPAPLFGMAENLAGRAGDLDARMVFDRFSP
jgi:diguanylate cyclase (GGDEF)-like protein